MAEQDQQNGSLAPEPASYALEFRALSLREMARISKVVLLPLFLLIKLIRIPVKKRFGIRYPVEVRELNPGDLPDEVRQRFASAEDRWSELGFVEAVLLRLGTTGCQELMATIAIHDSEAITATTLIAQLTLETGQEVVEEVFACASRDAEGRVFTTLSSPLKLDFPPEADRLHLAGASPESLLARHRERIPASALAGPPPSRAEVLDSFERVNNREVEFHIARGVYVPIPEAALPEDPEGAGLCDRCGDRSDQRRRFLDKDLCPSCIARLARGKRAQTFRSLALTLVAIVVGLGAIALVNSSFGPVLARRFGGGRAAELLVEILTLLAALIFLVVTLAILGRSLKKQREA